MKKNKQKKSQEFKIEDKDMLFQTLLDGGSLDQYYEMQQDASMPQEVQVPVTENDILSAWILGKDHESEQFAKGGHLHQGEYSFSPVWTKRGPLDWIGQDVTENPFYDPNIESYNAIQEQIALQPIQPKTMLVPQQESTYDLKDSVANFDVQKERPSYSTGDILGAAGTGIKWLADSYGKIRRVDDASNQIDAQIRNLQRNYYTGDNAYLKSQFEATDRFVPTTIEQNGGMSSQEGVLNGLTSIGEGAYVGSKFGPVGTVVGAGLGLAKGIGDWFLNRSAAEDAMNYNNLKGSITDKQNNNRFNLTVDSTGRLRNFGQLSRQYSHGGKMKQNGGYINSHYDYITDPLVKVEAGGTHQENPNEGVQTSIAPDGQPNLVEEGETIINNQDEGYVFSDRIVADKEILKSHLLPDKFAGKTYAEISKELDRIIEEHKTDEISKRTFDEMIKRLQEAQEDQKFQEKQAEVEKFLNGLSDDEKEALAETMVEEAEAEQQAAQEQAVAEQQAQEQAMQEQAMAEQGVPEEQMQMEQPVQETVPSRYDEIMSRAQLSDAASGGMFGKGGHLHQSEYSDLPFARRNYLENVGMRRDANTGNLLFNELVREPIVSDDPYTRQMAKEANDMYIQGNLLGLDLGTALNAINMYEKAGQAGSALLKARGAKDVIDEAGDIALKQAALGNKTGQSASELLKARQILDSGYDKAVKAYMLGNKSGVAPAQLLKGALSQAEEAVKTLPGVKSLYGAATAAGNASVASSAALGQYALLNGQNNESEIPVKNDVVIKSWHDIGMNRPRKTVNNTMSVDVPIDIIYTGDNVNGYSSIDGLQIAPDYYDPYWMPLPNYGIGKGDSTVRHDNDTIPTVVVADAATPAAKPSSPVGTGSSRKVGGSGKKNGTSSSTTTTIKQPINIGISPYNRAIDYIWNDPLNNVTEEDTDKLLEQVAKKRNGEPSAEPKSGTKPDTRSGFNWLRYAPAIGSGLQALSDALGITNKPDYTNADLYQRSINAIPTVNYVPIGSYLNYMPMDETYQQNVMRSQFNAARRAAQNNANGNAGAALTALDSLGFNEGNALGDLGIRVMDYNNQMGQKVAEHNLRINAINANNSLSAQEKNQAIAAEKARLNYNLAQMRQNIVDQNDLARAANRTNLFTNLGNIGRENFIMNQVNSNMGLYYGVDPRTGNAYYKSAYNDLSDDEKKVVDAYMKQNGITVK